MAADIPTKEPEKFNAGSTVKFTKNIPDYLPADGWTLSYSLVKDGKQISWSGANNGDGTHLVNISAASTANYTAGIYNWQSYVTKAGERYDIGAGVIEIKPNFAAQASGYDGRSDVKITLDAIVAMLKGIPTSNQWLWKINGKEVERYNLPDLIALHKRYLALYAAEQGRLVKKVLTQF